MGLSVEVSVGDSMGRLWTKDSLARRGGSEKNYSFDIAGKLIHTIEVNDELSLVGYIGLDRARETSRPIGKDVLGRWDWLRGKRKNASDWLRDKDRALKRIDGWIAGKVYPPSDFEDPEVNTDLVFGYGAEGRIASFGGPEGSAIRLEALNVDGKYRFDDHELTLVVSATAGVGSVDGAVKLGGSKVFHLESKDSVKAKKDTVALKKKALEQLIALKDVVQAHTGEMPDCGGNAQHDHPICKAARESAKANKKVEDAGNPSWRVRLSAGHMPLGELARLIGSFFRSDP